MTVSTATSDIATLSRSSRPAFGSLYSGSVIGPRISRSAITGRASRNTEPHQKYSSIRPPSSGPIALPAEKAEIQTAIARERCPGSWNIVKISDRVDGASVAPAIPSRARLRMSISALTRERSEQRQHAEGAGADEQQLAAADAVAERAHRHEEARDHEAVDVDDPEELRAARVEVGRERRHREVQHRQVHHVHQAREREDGQADPFAAARSGWGRVLDHFGMLLRDLELSDVVSPVQTARTSRIHRSGAPACQRPVIWGSPWRV